ncbi:hypothetical protein JKP88DRAFT_307469 [Tribonema minus]|uniref:Uncharacterized protein n=1 Tax=Tribonema minus TaxID=303371 RepID=A0A836CJ75_9STRA|nr:hypothetical protein JKP88DRAFT_307469 [Tribonema minus]
MTQRTVSDGDCRKLELWLAEHPETGVVMLDVTQSGVPADITQKWSVDKKNVGLQETTYITPSLKVVRQLKTIQLFGHPDPTKIAAALSGDLATPRQSTTGFNLDNLFNDMPDLIHVAMCRFPKITAMPTRIASSANLKILRFDLCTGLTTLPTLTQAMPNLEWVSLTHCTSLSTIPMSWRFLTGLRELSVTGCTDQFVKLLLNLRTNKTFAVWDEGQRVRVATASSSHYWSTKPSSEW